MVTQVSERAKSGRYVYREFMIQDTYTGKVITHKDVNVMSCFTWLITQYNLRGYTLDETEFDNRTRFVITQMWQGSPSKTWTVNNNSIPNKGRVIF